MCNKGSAERFKNRFRPSKIALASKGLEFVGVAAIRWISIDSCWRTNSKNSCLRLGSVAEISTTDEFTMLVWVLFTPTPLQCQ